MDTESADPVGLDAALRALDEHRIGPRIWRRDVTVWREDPTEIENRLGWLSVGGMRDSLPEIQRFAADLRERGIRDVVLLGMGGSSLAPEVFRATLGRPDGPALHVLDTTSPAWIRRVTERLDPAAFHVLVASKSGSTIEVRTLAAHFLEVARRAGADPPGRRFTAITDPGTALDRRAASEGFHHTFRNPPDIGGRFSALSLFGLVPAAIVGVDVEGLLARAEAMMAACGPDVPAARNPGLRLGAFLGAAAVAGRNKPGLLLPPGLAPFALWIEQLVAESTGKEDRGILPVTDEPHVDAASLGPDRCFVAVEADGEPSGSVPGRVDALRDTGQPVFRVRMGDRLALGAEMFRWELATTVAGHLLGVQPFDQPDVQSAKTQTAGILDAFARRERPAGPEPGPLAPTLERVKAGGYVAMMVYGDPPQELLEVIEAWRARVQRRFGVPTTYGLGPRFLHSTGQLHKGGPAGGIFVQAVLEEPALEIPGEPVDFAQLLRAQADGDHGALTARGRAVVRLAGRDATSIAGELAAWTG